MKFDNKGFYLTGVIIFIALILGSIVVCAPVRCGFSVNTPYKASFFDGKAISGHTIAVVPLLTKYGVDSSGFLQEEFQLKRIREARSDLECVSFTGAARKISNEYGDTLLQTFLTNLYNSDIPAIQTTDSLWNLIDEDFLVVVRMKSAHTIRTFSRDVHKRIYLEGELWDCRKAEAVFRVGINGICLTEHVRDDQFILNGIVNIFLKFPAPSPAYDTQAW